MTISMELFLSILSMDAYNRGYNLGISGLNSAAGAGVGSASIIDVDLPRGAQAASFYAVAYNDPSFGTTISCRDTDDSPADMQTGRAKSSGPLNVRAQRAA